MAERKKRKYIADDIQLMNEWDWERNAILPHETSFGSAKICWWKCSSCGFVWKTPAYTRGAAGSGCPECAKLKRALSRKRTAAQKNSFLKRFPTIAAEWHPTKNDGHRLEEMSAFSNFRVWWLCPNCGNEWQATINHRTKEGNGCPICSRLKGAANKRKTAAKMNNFSQNYPEIASEWHPIKNEGLKAMDVSASSNKKVWWLCSFCGNEWQATVNHRSSGEGCPKCAKAQTSFAEQIVYFYVLQVFPDAINRYKNEFEFDIYIPSLRVGIEYDGYFFHREKRNLVKDNLKDDFCQSNDIALIRFRSPKLNNTKSAFRITCEDHQLEKGLRELFDILPVPFVPDINIDRDSVKVRQQFRKTQTEKSLVKRFPNIAKQWHPIKNENLSPLSVPAFSNIKVWWLCEICGYEWQDTPNHRSSGRGCPSCSGKVVVTGKNDLGTLFPHLAQEWFFDKNGDLLPSQIACNSNKKVWWKCLKHGHVWQTAVSHRTRKERGSNCPYCGNKKVLVGFNDLATTYPEIAKQWNDSKNGELKPTDLTYGANKKVWWHCDICGNEWQAVVYSRTKGAGCPRCAMRKKNNAEN